MKSFLSKVSRGLMRIGINQETDSKTIIALESIENSYLRIYWPDYQEYMEESWFDDEAIFDLDNNSYFIPAKRLID